MPLVALVEAARVEAAKRQALLHRIPDHAQSLGTAALACFEDVPKPEDEPHRISATEHDASVLQLLVLVRAEVLSQGPKSEGTGAGGSADAPQRKAFGGTGPSAPAARLLGCIRRVMGENRQHFLHHRLQWLVFEQTKLRPQEFELPKTIDKSRMVQMREERQAWWSSASGHADRHRKDDCHIKKLAASATSVLAANRANRGLRSSKSAPKLGQVAGTGGPAAVPPCSAVKDKMTSSSRTAQSGPQTQSSSSQKRRSSHSCQKERAACAGISSTAAHKASPGSISGHARRRRDDKQPARPAIQLQHVEQNYVASVFRTTGDGQVDEDSLDCGAWISGCEDERHTSDPQKHSRQAMNIVDFSEGDARSGSQASREVPGGGATAAEVRARVVPGSSATAAEAMPMLPKALVSEWVPKELPELPPRAAAGRQGHCLSRLAAAPMPAEVPLLQVGSPGLRPLPVPPLPESAEEPEPQARLPAQWGQSPHGGSGRRHSGSSCSATPRALGAPRHCFAAAAAASQLIAGSLPLGCGMFTAMQERPRAKAERLELPVSSKASVSPGSSVAAASLPQRRMQPQQLLLLQAQPQQPQPLQPQLLLPPTRQRLVDRRIDSVLEKAVAQNTRSYVKIRGIGHLLQAAVPSSVACCGRMCVQHTDVLDTNHAGDFDAGWEASASSTCALQAAAAGNSTLPPPLQQQLPRPPRSSPVTLSPNQSAKWSEAMAQAQEAYLEEKASRQRLPMIPITLEAITKKISDAGVASEGSPEVVPLDIQYLNIDDDEAAPLLAGLRSRGVVFDSLLLAGNPRLTDVTYLTLLQLVCGRSAALGVRPQRLDLSGARNLSENSLLLLAQELRGQLSELQVLRMDKVPVAEVCWPALETSIGGLLRLEELGLADTQIGRVSQRSAASVADTLLGLPSLKNLDLSNNFFGLEGCRALAENLRCHKKLERLDLSHNAGGFVAAATTGGGHCAGTATGAAGLPGPGAATMPSLGRGGMVFNPMSLVCESISQARALKVLCLANCQLNFDEDFLLEEALVEKAGASMEEMDLSGNHAQGAMGVRCLLRLIVQHPALQRLYLREIREAVPTPASVPYELGDPDANYTLELGYPQNRALLRTLLRRCRGLGREDEAFQFSKDSEHLGQEVLTAWRSSQTVPGAGRMAFSFKLPCSIASVATAKLEDRISSMDGSHKLKVSLYSFVRITEIFRQLSDVEARRIFAGAMATDLTLTFCHLKCLSGLDTRLRLEITDRLLPAVQNLDRMRGFDLALLTRAPSTSGFAPLHVSRHGIFRLLLFNPRCPNGHYSLNLATPADRRVLEQIIIINGWEQACAKVGEHADLSQWGNHECVWNTLLNGNKLVWTSSEFTMPPRGEFYFDYCSPFHPPADAELVAEEVLDRLVLQLQGARCDPLPKAMVLRSELHRLNLHPQQCARLLSAFPSVGRSMGLGPDGSVQPQVQVEPPESARVDAFVALYSRCTDIGGLVSAEDYGLYGLKMLSRLEVHMARWRLGKLRTWDITRCDEEELCRWDLIVGPRSSDWRIRKQETDEDERKWQATLQDYCLLEDPTSRGNANCYALNLGIPGERQFAAVLLKLAKTEPGDHFDEPYWSTKHHLIERGTRWLVPEDWYTELPTDGIFRVRYVVGIGHCKDLSVRRALAEKYLGW